MLKKIFIILLIVITLNVIEVNAETFKGYITGDNVGFRECPSADSTLCPRITSLYLSQGHYIEMENKDMYEGPGCNASWYKGTYNSKVGYVCGDYLEFKNEFVPKDPSAYNTYQDYLIASGFEAGYVPLLAQLHEKYPNWEFQPVISYINWDSLINAQITGGKSCTYSSNQGYYLTDSKYYNYLTDKFSSVDPGCYATNSEATAYYIDPRNWLNERSIFMFEDLSFNPSNQTQAVVNSLLASNTNLNSHIAGFYNASTQYVCEAEYDNAGSYSVPTTCVKAATETDPATSIPATHVSISPVHLASRSRQEIGNDPTRIVRVNGQYPALYCGYSLTGYYNFYNIGAYLNECTPANTPSARGMAYACGPACKFNNTYGRPWDTAQKAINGGAQFIYKQYFMRGQDTIYFQKFNTSGLSTPFSNQYMQNVAAPYSEGSMTYNAYVANNVINNNIKFKIPVYLNMPLEAKLPNPGNPNNRLSNIIINNQSVANFNYDIKEYTINLPVGTPSVKLEATKINQKATVNGTGQINLNQNITELIIKVTAENQSVYEYKIKINYTGDLTNVLTPEEMISNASVKSDGKYIIDIKEGQLTSDLINTLLKTNTNSIVTIKNSNGVIKNTALATGDVLTITSREITNAYPIVVLGDGSGDGLINIIDLLKVQKQILRVSNASGPYLKAIDVDRDGQVTIKDLLKIQKHILGVSNIE